MNPLSIWVVYDGKPGHLSQALGLAERIADRVESNISTVKAKTPGILHKLAMLLCRQRVPPSSSILACYFFKPPKTPPDLIISFGGKVLPLNIALAGKHQSANILIGNRYHLNPQHFQVLVGANPQALKNHVTSTLPFCRSFAEPTQCNRPTSDLDTPVWACLIGGDGSGYRYHSAHWEDLLQTLKCIAQRHKIRWLLSTSRRTPCTLEKRLQEEDMREITADVILYHQKARSIRPFLTQAQRLFITADSLSMTSEAIAFAKPVYVINACPELEQQDCVHQRTLNNLTQAGLIHCLSTQTIGTSNGEIPVFNPGLSYNAQIETTVSHILRKLDWQPLPFDQPSELTTPFVINPT